jgi:hypothetical protein
MFNLFNMSFLKMWVPCSHFGTLFTRKSSALESRRFPGDSRDWPIALGAQTHQVHPTQPGRSLRRNGEPIVTVETKKSNKSHVGITRRLHYCINYCLHIPCHRSRSSRLTWINGGVGTLLVLLGSYLHHTCMWSFIHVSSHYPNITPGPSPSPNSHTRRHQPNDRWVADLMELVCSWNYCRIHVEQKELYRTKDMFVTSVSLKCFQNQLLKSFGWKCRQCTKKTMSNGTALYTFLPDPPCPLLHCSWRPADLAPSVTRIHT